MSTNQLRILYACLFGAVIILSGFWLSRSGKPYNGILFNVHKLVVLAAAVLFVMMLVRANRAAALGTVEWVAALAAGVFILTLVITGGLLNIDKQLPPILSTLHHVLPYPALLATAWTLYLLTTRPT